MRTKDCWADAWDNENPLKAKLANEYLSMANDYLTLTAYADVMNMSEPQAESLLALGQEFHEDRVKFCRVGAILDEMNA